MNAKEMQAKIAELEAQVEQLAKENEELKTRKGTISGGRKYDVLETLRQGPISITDLATKLDTTSKNISSVLTMLRKDGAEIFTNSRGEKVLMEESAELRATYPPAPISADEFPDTAEALAAAASHEDEEEENQD